MSYNFDDINIGGQVKVGTGIVPACLLYTSDAADD